MVTLMRVGLLSVLGLVGASQLMALPAGNEKPKVKVEFRRAETEAAKGLTEAKVAGSDRKIYMHKEVAATNEDIAKAKVSEDAQKNIVIEIEFTKDGAKKIAAASKQHKDKPLAIVVDGKVLSAPVVWRAEIGDRAMITGDFTRAEADRIVAGINRR